MEDAQTFAHTTISTFPSTSSGVSENNNNNRDIDDNAVLTPDPQDYFEGNEKVLCIWFTTTKSTEVTPAAAADLRLIPEDEVHKLMETVNCKIIHREESKEVTTYILSESSLVVSRRHFMLKTCGTTTPLRCLPYLNDLVQRYTELDLPVRVLYHRGEYGRPEMQAECHRNFSREVKLLEAVFGKGRVDYFPFNPTTPHNSIPPTSWNLFSSAKSPVAATTSIADTKKHLDIDLDPVYQKLEMALYKSDTEVLNIFTTDACLDGDEAARKSGLDTIIPSVDLDNYLFFPCGYSMNGLYTCVWRSRSNSRSNIERITDDEGFVDGADDDDGHYLTLHITPQEAFSYVSFETNVTHVPFDTIAQRVLNIFKPKFVRICVFANQESLASSAHTQVPQTLRSIYSNEVDIGKWEMSVTRGGLNDEVTIIWLAKENEDNDNNNH